MSKYHYTKSGLDNVWLVNGFHEEETPYGLGVTIERVKELHAAIASALVDKAGALTGKEFRYIRRELELSQARLGELMGVTAQSVANWEKDHEVKEPSDFLLRHIYKQTIGGRQSYMDLVDQLKNKDLNLYNGELAFKETKEGWQKAS